MEPVGQLILRSLPLLAEGPFLLVNPERDGLFRELASSQRSVRLSTGSFSAFRFLGELGAEVHFETYPKVEKQVRHLVMVLPREKERLAMLLQAAADCLEPEGRLWLAGSNRSGAKSAPGAVKRHFDRVVKLDAARHCSLYEATGPLHDVPFRLEDFAHPWRAREGGPEFVSLPGVFAHRRLDPGSALLLESFEGHLPRGRFLDFGCGCGLLAISLLAAGADIDPVLLDDSALALEASRLGLERNGFEGGLLASDGLSELSGRFDWIISNPPFHRGIDHDLDVAADFIRRAGTFLSDNGRIRVVFNRHLPYAAWLRSSFDQVERMAESRSFTVLQASKPK